VAPVVTPKQVNRLYFLFRRPIRTAGQTMPMYSTVQYSLHASSSGNPSAPQVRPPRCPWYASTYYYCTVLYACLPHTLLL